MEAAAGHADRSNRRRTEREPGPAPCRLGGRGPREQAVSRAEGIRRFRILPGTFEVGAELTPTQKVRRDYVLAKYASDIDALYA